MAKALRVQGLNELVRAFQVANREVAKDVKVAIEEAGEPIRKEASELARSEISGMARSRIAWWSMRTGVIRNSIGYIAPVQRGVKTLGKARRRRPNLAPLLAEREHRALDNNRDRVYDEFVQAMNRVARVWGRV